MSKYDDEQFRLKVGRPKARNKSTTRFISRVVEASARAGHPIGRTLRSGAPRPGAKLGRGHVASRMAGETLSSRSRRVIIKTRLVVAKRSSPRSTARHLRYIERDGVTREGGRGQLHGPTDDEVDAKTFEERVRGDRHQFRFIVSPEDAIDIGDLKAFTRELMSQVERDLGTRLEWVAVDHWDTEHPHIHIVLRGADEAGHDLIIAREYISRGIRVRAAELATEWLGERTERDIRVALTREVNQERWTSLDREIQGQVREQMIDFRSDAIDVEGRHHRSLLIGRLDQLVDMGLADKTEPGVWQLHPEAEPTLRAMGERGDIIRTMQRTFTRDQREYVIVSPARMSATIVGRIAAKGLADELNDRAYVIVDGIDGRAHYAPLSPSVDIADLPVGGIVELRGASNLRTADRNIAAVADGGIYKASTHVALAKADARIDQNPQSFVEAHVRRLEALRRAGIVERIGQGVWQIPDDLPERGRRYDAERADGALVELRSHLAIKQQVRAMGATWLDRQLISGSENLSVQGFGAQVKEALRAREVFLVEQGLAEQRGQRVILARDLLSTLQSRELQATGAAIESEAGLTYRPIVDGDGRVAGVYRRSLMLASGRFAMLDDGMGFTLVPWRPVVESRLGRSVTAVVRGEHVSWEFGRKLGLSI
jgi:type IV secretory pathway VirD2 relaxase